MENRVRKTLNCEKELIAAIPKFIEAFVKYYGEDYRQEIEEKFSKAKFIGYLTYDDIRAILSNYEKEKTDELMERFIEDNNLKYSKEFLMGIYNSLEFSDHLAIKEMIDLITVTRVLSKVTKEEIEEISIVKEIPDEYKDIPVWLQNDFKYNISIEDIQKEFERNYSYLETRLVKLNPDINKDNLKELIEGPEFMELYNLKDAYNKMVSEYNEEKKQFEEYYLEIERMEKVKQQLREKYYRDFIKENIDLIPEDKREGLDEFLADPRKYYKLNNYITDVLGISIHSMLDVEGFTSNNEELLNDPNTPEWQTDSIKYKRIRYFKKIGFDLGYDYETYLNNEDVQKNWPSVDKIDQLIASQEHYNQVLEKEFISELESFKKLRSEIDALNLLDKADAITPDLYRNKGIFVSPNVVKTATGYDLFSLVAINFGFKTDNSIDHDIVHELNHLFELHLTEIIGDHIYQGLCGWDILACEFNQSSDEEYDYNEEKRSYELFNEIINELIAQEICEQMHEDNVYVFGDENNTKYKNVTSYDHALFLAKDFFNEYKDKIIESRRNGKIDIIYKEVGKKNFEELNSLFEIFEENFGGMKIYNLLGLLKNNEDTKLTRIYYDLIDRRNQILEKMHQYKEVNSSKEQHL